MANSILYFRRICNGNPKRSILTASTAVAICMLSSLLTGCKSSTNIAYSHNTDIIQEQTSVGAHHYGKVVEEAYTWVGTPYKYATAEKGEGTDCSGLVMKVYQDALGYKLPRNSEKQAEFCHPVKDEKVKSGDLVFFATGKDPEKVSHVGIMVDNINFIHASSSKGVVVSKINTPYYKRTFLMFGRVPMTEANR